MKHFVLGLALTVTTLGAVGGPAHAGPEPYIGEIEIFAGSFAPKGWALCQGQLLPIAQNTALYSILQTTYGGDGVSTFALPDLRDAEAKLHGAHYIIALTGVFPSRE